MKANVIRILIITKEKTCDQVSPEMDENIRPPLSKLVFFRQLRKCCNTVPKTDLTNKTAVKKGDGIDFFGSVHIEQIAQLVAACSKPMSERFQKMRILRVSAVFSIVTAIALFQFWEMPIN
ncbi:hypothetical protein Y032_0796g2398 [Ancylostoma ceylanicum]|uniref:Uncharacterized protein n=1 Tax=Ancylostoma ceylanicum TaxID=53326 RepID=A0A016WC21_9BILA|nr:hypothetical protein Y032_0796g2398 [Ancylostoma ceylanicum]